MKSSPRFWLVALSLAALAAVIEAAPHAAAAGSAREPATPVATLEQFLRSQGAKPLANERLRWREGHWWGWRFEAAGCTAVVLPLPPGGDSDIDLRRKTPAGKTARFIYAGRSYETPPTFAANAGRIVELAEAALGMGPAAPNFYVALIEQPGCKAGEAVDWAKLWA